MVVPDTLSRREDHFKGTEDDNKDVTLLPKELWVNHMDEEWLPISKTTTEQSEKIILFPKELWINQIDEELKSKFIMNDKDDIMIKALNALKSEGLPPLNITLADWKEEDSLIFYKGKCYVPDNLELRKEIVK